MFVTNIINNLDVLLDILNWSRKYFFWSEVLDENFKRIFIEKLFLQRYGEQSVRWQLCAPYRCKNKCLLGICFYSDIKHKSNNTTKHAQKVTSVVEFQAQKILANIIQNTRLLKWTFMALQMVKVWVATVFWDARTHLAHPDWGAHSHVCAHSISSGRISHPHPHFW